MGGAELVMRRYSSLGWNLEWVGLKIPTGGPREAKIDLFNNSLMKGLCCIQFI